MKMMTACYGAPPVMADLDDGSLFGSLEFCLPAAESVIDQMSAPPAPAAIPLSPGSSACASQSLGAAGSRGPALPKATVLFAGVPSLTNGEAILYDSRQDSSGALPEEATICRLEARFPDGTPALGELDGSLYLLIYVDDLVSPRARVRLADLTRQRGERPLNVSKLPGQLVRLVLIGRAGAWKGSTRLEVALAWQT
jgi:Ca-activated chloride channel family protein